MGTNTSKKQLAKKQLDATTLPPENFAVSPGSIQVNVQQETLTYDSVKFHTTA